MRSISTYLLIPVLTMVVALSAMGQADFKGDPINKENLKKTADAAAQKKGLLKELITSINSHGVDFNVTPGIEDELRAAKVPPPVIAAAKENFRLPNGKRASFLTITANVPEPQFVIEGQGPYTGGVLGQPLAPGTYKVTAKKVGYSPQSQTVEIRVPGKRTSINFELKEMPVSELIAEANAAFKRGDYPVVNDLCQRVRLREPTNATANKLLGLSYMSTREFDKSLDYLLLGIRGGQFVTFSIGRHRGNGGYEFGALRLKATAIRFVNEKARFGSQVQLSDVGEDVGEIDFEVPYSKIRNPKLDHQGLIWRISMDVDVPKGSGGKVGKTHFDFGLPATGSDGIEGVCSNCQNQLNLILRMISGLSTNAK